MLALTLALQLLAAPPPTVTMYGASWCGPCHAVRDFLTKAGITYEFVDIDDERGYERFAKVKVDGGIPLTVVNGETVLGANMTLLRSTLERHGVRFAAAPAALPGQLYGTMPATWWQQQFVSLRARVKAARARVQELDRVAVDDVGRGVTLPRLKQQLAVLEGALAQLERDASYASLPRQYRGD